MAAILITGRMRGAVPAKKRESNEQANRPTSAKERRKRGTEKARANASKLKSRRASGSSAGVNAAKEVDLEEKAPGKAPKRKSGSLRGAARRVKQAIPDIVDRMVEEAKKGNVQHVKTVLHCTGVDKLLEQECQTRKKKSLAELLIRRLETQNETEESERSRTESE